MKMTLYHGTDCLFKKIELYKSDNYMDFGKGFYTTTMEHFVQTRMPEICWRISCFTFRCWTVSLIRREEGAGMREVPNFPNYPKYPNFPVFPSVS